MPVPNTNVIAIDLGAESCRVSLLRWEGGHPEILVVHRFPNAPVQRGSNLYWDISYIDREIANGLNLCSQQVPSQISSIGVDGWAVDYVRLLPGGQILQDPFCYRDERTIGAQQRFHQRIAPETLYKWTGIQLLPLNTVYQLFADGEAGIPAQTPWINLPEYISVRLGAERFAEYTNATHTGLVRLGTHQWCPEIFELGNLSLAAAPPIVSTGSFVGKLSGELTDLPHLDAAKLVAPACHDTASAVAAIPDTADDWVFISSGTWSLVGTLLDAPCVRSETFDANFTNLGGVGGKICFLKNVNGMWLLRQCLDEWQAKGHAVELRELISASEELPLPRHLLDVDDPVLLMPGNMLQKINSQLQSCGFSAIASDRAGIPAFASLIFHSLAARYDKIIRDITSITGKRFRRIYIVGGGSRNAFLNRLTAQYTGLEVLLGPAESSTLGNLAVQMAALDEARTTGGVSHEAMAFWAGRMYNQVRAA